MEIKNKILELISLIKEEIIKLHPFTKFKSLDFKKKVVIIIIIFIILYSTGFLSQYFANTYYYKEQLKQPKETPISLLMPSPDLYRCVIALLYFPFNLKALIISCAAFTILISIIVLFGKLSNSSSDDERGFSYSKSGTYGTSAFMDANEMKEVLTITTTADECEGTILGEYNEKVLSMPIDSFMNRNIAVYGAAGSMKSRAFVRNMIIQCAKREESMVITDPSGEMYEDTALYLKELGYVTKQFNLVFPQASDSWNCLSAVGQDELMAQVFADVIIKNTSGDKPDHFWDNAEMNLLKALILFVEFEVEEPGRTIGEVYKLITKVNSQTLDSMFDMLDISHPAKASYNIYRQSSEGTRSAIIIGLGSRLQVFQNKMIRMITGYDDIDLSLPGYQKCVYFIITSEQDSTFDFLSSLFFSFLFIKLVNYAKQYGENLKLPVPVNVILDEFPNIGIIVDFNKKISTVRKYQINISVIFQNVAQMKNRYPNDVWQEIIGNCDAQLFLGCTDEITAKFISDRSGIATIDVSSESKQFNTIRISNYTPDFRKTDSVNKRNILTPDEVLRLSIKDELIILRGQKILKAKKFDYTKHPEHKKFKRENPTEHVPVWNCMLDEEEKNYVENLIPSTKKTATSQRKIRPIPKKGEEKIISDTDKTITYENKIINAATGEIISDVDNIESIEVSIDDFLG